MCFTACNVPVVSLLDNVLQSLIDFFDLVVQSGRGTPIDVGYFLLSSRQLFVLECLHSEATQQEQSASLHQTQRTMQSFALSN